MLKRVGVLFKWGYINKCSSLLILAVLLLYFFCTDAIAQGSLEEREDVMTSITSITQEELNQVGLDEVRSYLAHLDRETQEILPTWNPLEWIKNGISLDFRRILQSITGILWREVVITLSLLGKIMVLAVIGAVLTYFQEAWAGRESLGNLVQNVVYLIFLGLSFRIFSWTVCLGLRCL